MLIKIEWIVLETIYQYDYLLISGLNGTVHHQPEVFTGNVVARNLISSANSLQLHFHSDMGGTTNLGNFSYRNESNILLSRLSSLLQTVQNATFTTELR